MSFLNTPRRGLLAAAVVSSFFTPSTAFAQLTMPPSLQPDAAAPISAEARLGILRDIRVEGLQRIEPGTVFSYLPLKVGDEITQASLADVIRRLFATGFFRDVQARVESDVLVILVEERPSIGSIEITGSREFDKETLLAALADTGLAEARVFDRALLDRAEQELKRQYLSRGKYDTQVQTTVTPLERNRVAVSIAVDEGEEATIREIRIVGAKAFDENDLLDEFQLAPPNWLSWYTGNDQYSRQKLAADQETLRSYYLDRGYLEFVLDSTQVTLSPDRRDVFIVMSIQEGRQFKVGEVRLSGDLLDKKEEFDKLVKIKTGETFSNQKLQDLAKGINDRMGELGYAFSAVNPVPSINREIGIVDFNIVVDPGRRVYVRRINITGNTKTRDEVIRRELRQFEASWFDSERVRLSRDRIDRLGYFRNVDVATDPVPGTTDQVDLNVKVDELPLGALTFGVGFSSTESLVLSGSITQRNFLGTGTDLGLELNTSKINRTIAVNYTDPFWTDDGISRGFEIASRTFDASELDELGEYKIVTNSASVRFGIPYTDIDRVFLGATIENTQLELTPTSPQLFKDEAALFGENSTAYVLSLGTVRDTRDSGIAPTRGRLQSFNIDYATPLGEREYYRATYSHLYFTPITRRITLGLKGDIGIGGGLGGNRFPLTKNFFAGGIGSVRGFAPSSIGPTYPDTGGRRGGNRRIVFNSELLFPFPGTGQDRTLRLFTFFDAGAIWAEDQSVDLSQLRASYGAGLSWLSPVGPLKLSIGQVLRKSLDDKTQRFQFQIGTTF